MLEKQVFSSVYFEDTILNMEAVGIDTVVEVGPGKVEQCTTFGGSFN